MLKCQWGLIRNIFKGRVPLEKESMCKLCVANTAFTTVS